LRKMGRSLPNKAAQSDGVRQCWDEKKVRDCTAANIGELPKKRKMGLRGEKTGITSRD